jgi:hypothetical protein
MRPYKGNESFLDFFIPNLPFGKEITVTFTTDTKKNIELNIKQTAGLYTIQKNNNDELSYVLAPLGDPITLDPVFPLKPISLAKPFAFNINRAESLVVPSSTNKNEHLTIYNIRERSVVLSLLLVSQHSDLSDEERAIALYILINAHKSAEFSLELLQDLWATQYSQATRKDRPTGDLQLHLDGHRQIIYPEKT